MNKKLIKADSGISGFIGQRLDVYAENKEGTPERIIYYTPSKETKLIVIHGRDVSGVTQNGIFYDNEDGSKTKKVDFNTSDLPSVYINGKLTNIFNKSDFAADNAIIYAINNDSDNYIDYVNVYKFESEVIAGTITEN